MSDRRGFLRGLAAAARDATAAAQPAAAGEPMPNDAPPPPVLDGWLDRYSRQLVLPEWSEAAQRRLGEASVLVVGAGALGSPVATYLAGAGVGRLGIVDDGDVELSNLHRQHLHFTPDVGEPKAHSAAAKLGFLNPEVAIEPYQARFGAAMLDGQDLVVDCTDSFETRYAVNAACCAARVPLVEGGVIGLTGIVMAIRPGETACYRCAFPQPPAPGSVPSCAQAGILGPAAGVVGSLQALEALKLLAGLDGALTGAFLQVDLASHDYLRVAVRRRESCPDCAAP
jgi:molybdopterin/thiamine biosynthesis adenylyltransferase